MRFTKIPLIATLMAVALSLLIVLPTLAQVSGDRTDGRLSVGQYVDVRVADNVDDLDNKPRDDRPTGVSGGNALAIGDDRLQRAGHLLQGRPLHLQPDGRLQHHPHHSEGTRWHDNLVTVLPGRDGKLGERRHLHRHQWR